jgi:hypothetical protein
MMMAEEAQERRPRAPTKTKEERGGPSPRRQAEEPQKDETDETDETKEASSCGDVARVFQGCYVPN